MTDEYETLLELARQAQRAAAHLWHWREISAQEYADARALYAGAEALRRERVVDSAADTLWKRVQEFAAAGGAVTLEDEVRR